MPDVPRVRLPHPVAGSSNEFMMSLADEIAPRLIAVLQGEELGDNVPVGAGSGN